MFQLNFEDRLTTWRSFRESLEMSKDPIQDTIDFYNNAPLVTIATDPYTPSTWPDPWELLEENNYCSFVKILAICYTLQLTDVLSQASYKIHITHDRENSSTYYLLYVDDRVVGFNGDSHVHQNELPENFISQFEHVMLPIH
jgi:hypothetical protein